MRFSESFIRFFSLNFSPLCYLYRWPVQTFSNILYTHPALLSESTERTTINRSQSNREALMTLVLTRWRLSWRGPAVRMNLTCCWRERLVHEPIDWPSCEEGEFKRPMRSLENLRASDEAVHVYLGPPMSTACLPLMGSESSVCLRFSSRGFNCRGKRCQNTHNTLIHFCHVWVCNCENSHWLFRRRRSIGRRKIDAERKNSLHSGDYFLDAIWVIGLLA